MILASYILVALREGQELATEVARIARPSSEKGRLGKSESSPFLELGHAQIIYSKPKA
jgi:hypothetical protein